MLTYHIIHVEGSTDVSLKYPQSIIFLDVWVKLLAIRSSWPVTNIVIEIFCLVRVISLAIVSVNYRGCFIVPMEYSWVVHCCCGRRRSGSCWSCCCCCCGGIIHPTSKPIILSPPTKVSKRISFCWMGKTGFFTIMATGNLMEKLIISIVSKI